MSITEMSITNPKKQLEFYKQLSEQLQQENKQLKENNMSMQEEMVRTWKKVDLYKEVIEEAREYIEESSLEVNTKEFGNLTVCNSDDLLEILDKVKEMSNE